MYVRRKTEDMDLFSILTLLGGLAFFLYGMHAMSSGLEKLAGGKLERTLRKITSSRIKSLMFGAGITIAIQSSSAMTVMLVGLVNSGIMNLNQTIGIIMGSNIGTTGTAWILSLSGLESSNTFIRLLKPENFSPIVALIGISLIMGSKKHRHKDIGMIMVGFAVLMFGMNLMSGAVSPLAESENFSKILTAFNNPILGVLVGAVFTGIIQSSAASVAVLQALSLTGSISAGMAIPIIMGQNIGTCVTAVIASIGVTRSAKRVAAVHMSFNIIGTTLCLVLFYALDAVFSFSFKDSAIGALGIAVSHSLFNITSTVFLLPFSGMLEKLALKIVPDKAETGVRALLDDRLLLTPSFAISECRNKTADMAYLARDTLLESIELIEKFDTKLADKIITSEDTLDMYEDKLGSFLVKIATKNLTVEDSREVSKLLRIIGDLERIGDHALNITDAARELYEKDISFSSDAMDEYRTLASALTEILNITMLSFEKNSIELAIKVEPLEQVIDGLIDAVKTRHIDRLQCGKCTITLGFILSDLLNNFERVSDHCSNIAVCIIEIDQGSLDTHEYLHGIKTTDKSFLEAFNIYSEKYRLN